VARKEWRLILLNLTSNLVDTLSEGGTLAVLFLAVQILTATAGAPFNWHSNPLLNWNPTIASWLNLQQPKLVFLGLLVFAVLLQALQSLMRFLNLISVGYFAAKCRARVTERIHAQVLSLSFPCASSYKTGDLIDYVNQGPEAIRIQIEQTSLMLVSLFLSITYIVVLIGISPSLLVAVVVFGAITALVQKKLLPSLQLGSQRVTTLIMTLSSIINEDFQALRLLHTSGHLGLAETRVSRSVGELEDALRSQTRKLAIITPLFNFLPTAAIAIIGVFAVLFLGSRSTGILPSLVTFVLALQRLNIRLSGIASSQNALADNTGKMNRLNKILSTDSKQFRRLSGRSFKKLINRIEFDSVTLRYGPDFAPVLSNVSFTIPKGHTIALVGPSGAGKSSIADLLAGLYEATNGRILVDGVSLNQYDLTSWQHRIGVVSQDTFLFNASIAENITFGLDFVSESQIDFACHAAQAVEFIQSLPYGYDTIVGERGYRLSGGQRQRLSLARAILRDPDLLILDEATSALDSQSEMLVQQAIDRFERNHTVLVIAHRLSTIVNADEILVLDCGRIIENGVHAELLAKNGLYAKLWKQQTTIQSNLLNS
jgi:ATP-binding cassette subfamily B protein/subfamily B ATP-binding cassette protein MsbA